jgi:hypothetical protein
MFLVTKDGGTEIEEVEYRGDNWNTLVVIAVSR